MAWVETPSGAVNLDRVVRAVADSSNNGDVFLYLDHANYITVSFGSSTAEAAQRVQQLVRAVEPSDI